MGFEKTGGVNCTLPPPPPPPPPGQESTEATVQPQATLEVAADAAVLEPGSAEQEEFIQQLIAELAASLGLDPSEIVIDPASLREGGRRRLQDRRLQATAIQFDFVIASDNGVAAIAERNQQLADPDSALRNSPTTSAVNPEVQAVLEFVCPENMVIPEGLSTCRFCDPGKEPDDDGGCQPCSAVDRPGAAFMVSENGTCHSCEPGKTPNALSTECISCANGKFSTDGALCQACPAGQGSNFLRDGCTCLENFYNATLGEIVCYDDGGQYPLDYVPNLPNSDVDACRPCDPLQCVSCTYDPEGDRVSRVKVKRGHSISEQKLLQGVQFEDLTGHRGVFPCQLDAQQKTVNTFDHQPEALQCGCSAEIHVRDVNPDTGLEYDLNPGCSDDAGPCKTGYQGPLCSYCAPGYSRPGLKGQCEECSSVASILWVFFAGLVAIFFVTGVLYFVASFDASAGKLTVIVTLGKITVSLIQVLAQLEFTLQLTWPAEFKWLIDNLRFMSFDFLGFLDIGCMTTYSYFGKFSFAFMMIPILVGCVMCTYQCRSHVDNIKNRCIKMGLTAVFFCYPFVSQSMFQGFSCRTLDAYTFDGEEETERYLDVDYQVSCNSMKYIGFVLFGTIGVCAFPLGIPSLTLLLLFKNGKQIKNNGPARARYEFLVADYRPEFYYWDCFEMLRKVSITGVLMFLSPGSLFQLVVGIVLCIAFGFSAAWFRPYVSGVANIFKVGTEVTLLVTLVLAVMLKIDLSTEALPCIPWDDDAEESSCGDSFIGIVMFLTNTAIPTATFVIGLFTEGINYNVTFPNDMSISAETDNPLAGMDSADPEAEDETTFEKESSDEDVKKAKGKK